MEFVYTDGGREKAGFKGKPNDCATRAFAIASGRPYREINELIRKLGRDPRKGVPLKSLQKLAQQLGARWIPLASIGKPSTVKLVEEQIPAGKVVCSLRAHVTAVIDGVIHDVWDPQNTSWVDEAGELHTGKRTVYGYWIF